jgi:DNA primase
MATIIETIKAKVDVVDEIGLVVSLQKSGKALKGLCPFHNERTPSFYVFPETQTWRCFGCNEGGDLFSFVQKQQGMDFSEALRYLAEKAGVSVEESGGWNREEDREAQAIKERLRKLNEDALLWFHQMLLRSKEATEVRTYVQSRGISADSVVAFGLGYAPEHWDSLSRYLLGKGYTERELVSGGLARERGDGFGSGGSGEGLYDYFRHRLIFPIRDARGRVIGFGGRAIGDGQPKYLNSPQTLLFEKNSVLYALDMARDAIKQEKQVIIVEGYVDAVIAHQYGTKQTVACIGSAITEKHILQLKKLTRQVTLALDPDAAGESATEHGIQEVLKTYDRVVVPVPLPTGAMMTGNGKRNEPRGMIRLEEQVDAEINVLRLPPGEDPDEVIRNNLSSWTYAVAHPQPLVDYYFEAKTMGLNLREPYGQAEAAKRLLPLIGNIMDRARRDIYMRKLSSMIHIDERTLYTELQSVLRNQKSPGVIADFTGKQHGGTPFVGVRPASPDTAGEDGNTWSGTSNARDGASGVQHGAGDDDELPGQKRTNREHETPFVGLDRNARNRIQWEDYLIGLLMQNPGLSPEICGIITDGDFLGTDTRELYHILNSVSQRGSSSLFVPLEQLAPSALLSAVERAKKRVESGFPKDGAGLQKDAVQCAKRLKRECLLQLNTEYSFVLRDAEHAGDVALKQQVKQQLRDIQRLLRTIYTASRLQG